MAGYTREFLIDAFMSRYINCDTIPIEKLERLKKWLLIFMIELVVTHFVCTLV